MCILSYNLLPRFYLRQRYTIGYLYAAIIRHIFQLEYSTLVSDLYGLMQRILYVIFVGKVCHLTMPLVNTVLSKMGPYMEFDICMQ